MRHLLASLIGLVVLVGCEVAPTTSTAHQPGVITTISQSVLAAGNNNDWSDTPNYGCQYNSTHCLLVGTSPGSTITGLDHTFFSGGSFAVWLMNDGAVPVTIANNSNLSAAANRIFTRSGEDVILAPGYGIWIASLIDWDTFMPIAFREIDMNAVDTVVHSTPSRSLGTAFQPSLSRITHVCYSVQIDWTLTLAGGQTGRAEILSDASNPPTTIRGSVAGGQTGTLVVGVSLAGPGGGQLCALVRPKDWVLVRGVNVVGTPTFTITRQVEDLL